MVSFKSFLRKSKFFVYCDCNSCNGLSVKLSDLGDWAWQQFLPEAKGIANGENVCVISDYDSSFLEEIAVACLGKKDFENRMKGLKKQSKKEAEQHG